MRPYLLVLPHCIMPVLEKIVKIYVVAVTMNFSPGFYVFLYFLRQLGVLCPFGGRWYLS